MKNKYFFIALVMAFLFQYKAFSLDLTIRFLKSDEVRTVTNVTLISSQKWTLDNLLENKYLILMAQIFLKSSDQLEVGFSTLMQATTLSQCVIKKLKSPTSQYFKSIESLMTMCACYNSSDVNDSAHWVDVANEMNTEKLILKECTNSTFSSLLSPEMCQDDIVLDRSDKFVLEMEVKIIKKIDAYLEKGFLDECASSSLNKNSAEYFDKNCVSVCKNNEYVETKEVINPKTGKSEIHKSCKHFCSLGDKNTRNEKNLVALSQVKRMNNKNKFWVSKFARALKSLLKDNSYEEALLKSSDLNYYASIGFVLDDEITHCFHCPEGTTLSKINNECLNDEHGCVFPIEKFDTDSGCIRRCIRGKCDEDSCFPVLKKYLWQRFDIKKYYSELKKKDESCDMHQDEVARLKKIEALLPKVNILLNKKNLVVINDIINKAFQGPTSNKYSFWVSAFASVKNLCLKIKEGEVKFIEILNILDKFQLANPLSFDLCKKSCEVGMKAPVSGRVEECIPIRCAPCDEKILRFSKMMGQYDYQNTSIGKCSVVQIKSATDIALRFIDNEITEKLMYCLEKPINGEFACRGDIEKVKIESIIKILKSERFNCIK